MKIGFFGTPDIASYCLEELHRNHEIVFAVAPCDKPAGRNLQMQCCAAKEKALSFDIPILQPDSLRDPSFPGTLDSFDADIFVVVAYGKLIPRSVFDRPRLKTINLHPSLLPKYRGAAPIQWALINGEKETGVTVQLINEKMDAGDIIAQEKISVSEDMNAEDLYRAVLPVGARLLDQAINALASGTASPRVQDESQVSLCGKITHDTARIDWSSPAENIHNLVRGLNPRPVAWTTFRGQNLKIFRSALFTESIAEKPEPGQVIRLGKKRLLAGTGRGPLEILELQLETKKRVDAQAFINGQRLEAADRFI
jgi:methionyl-tRNA formyltransferase